MNLESHHTTATIDHFEKHGQLNIPRWHYEVHFDTQPQLGELAGAYTEKLLDKLPDAYFYPPIPNQRLHLTLQEALRQDGIPGQYSEEQMCEFDKKIQHMLDNWESDTLELEIGKEAFLGEDALLLAVDPADEIKRLRNEIRRILDMPPGGPPIPHVSLAYSKARDNVQEIYREAESVDDIASAKVSVGALVRVAQSSNGRYYDWDDDQRKFLHFRGARS